MWLLNVSYVEMVSPVLMLTTCCIYVGLVQYIGWTDLTEGLFIMLILTACHKTFFLIQCIQFHPCSESKTSSFLPRAIQNHGVIEYPKLGGTRKDRVQLLAPRSACFLHTTSVGSLAAEKLTHTIVSCTLQGFGSRQTFFIRSMKAMLLTQGASSLPFSSLYYKAFKGKLSL